MVMLVGSNIIMLWELPYRSIKVKSTSSKEIRRFPRQTPMIPNLTVVYSGNYYYDHIGIISTATGVPGYGIGGKFIGGYYGVCAEATAIGENYNHYAGVFKASGGPSNYGVHATAPTGTYDYAGYFDGKVYASAGYYQGSDEKLKKDVIPINGVIEKVMKLKPVNYYFKTDEFPEMNLPKNKQAGLIAQELEAVFPDFVGEATMSQEKDTLNPGKQKQPETFKTVDYTSLIPVLVAAIQEQQKMIDELRKKID